MRPQAFALSKGVYPPNKKTMSFPHGLESPYLETQDTVRHSTWPKHPTPRAEIQRAVCVGLTTNKRPYLEVQWTVEHSALQLGAQALTQPRLQAHDVRMVVRHLLASYAACGAKTHHQRRWHLRQVWDVEKCGQVRACGSSTNAKKCGQVSICA